ncbi:MAG: hypothetical protein V1899_03150 [Planctomycetota bacterium]
MTQEELIWFATLNLTAVITETNPDKGELFDLLQSELRKLVQEENSHWYGFRARTPRCGTNKAA